MSSSPPPAAPPPPPPPSSPLPSPAPGSPPAPRMARRPEVLCGAALVLGCAFLAALRVSCSRAKDVTMPAKVPVSFFPSTSAVHDLYLGQLDHAEDFRQDSEITLFFFYAPWCGQSVAVREEVEKVANRLADQVLFVAINCWWNQGKCRKQKHFFYFPVIYLYHQSFGPIEYKGPMKAVYIEKFVRRVMSPLLYISSRAKLQRFLSSYEPGVLGYFEFNASPQPPGYLTFFTSALHSLNKDYLGTIHFGVITDKLLAREIPLTRSGSVYLHRHVNASLLFPHEAMNYTAENVWKWALENGETFIRWLRPHGGKSLLLNNELKKGPALFLFVPFDPLAERHPLVEEISALALEYNRCNRSHVREEPAGQVSEEALAADAGETRPGPESFSIAKLPCCNTVVLVPPWPPVSRTHNVCELCINQRMRASPSRLGRPRCSFWETEAALDYFFLKEQTFFPGATKTASLCSNFLSFYSPFSYYSACCRGPLALLGPEKGAAQPVEEPPAFCGKRPEAPAPPQVKDGSRLLAGSGLYGSFVAGLGCRTNKTLNLYLLDSNLFWLYAERLGASRSAPVREFAAIVDLKEETHYVLDDRQALLRSSLEAFIQNYSVPYSPLKRHLVGRGQPGPSHTEHAVREVSTRAFRELVLRSEKDVLLLYYAPWCGFCVSLNHVFIQLARILPPDRFIVARVSAATGRRKHRAWRKHSCFSSVRSSLHSFFRFGTRMSCFAIGTEAKHMKQRTNATCFGTIRFQLLSKKRKPDKTQRAKMRGTDWGGKEGILFLGQACGMEIQLRMLILHPVQKEAWRERERPGAASSGQPQGSGSRHPCRPLPCGSLSPRGTGSKVLVWPLGGFLDLQLSLRTGGFWEPLEGCLVCVLRHHQVCPAAWLCSADKFYGTGSLDCTAFSKFQSLWRLAVP